MGNLPIVALKMKLLGKILKKGCLEMSGLVSENCIRWISNDVNGFSVCL